MSIIARWVNALDQMARPDAARWSQLDIVSKWLIAVGAPVLFITFAAAALGGLLAWGEGRFDPWVWLLTCIGLLFAHASNNLLNDLTDSKQGIDKDNYYRNQYSVHLLEDKLVSPTTFHGYIAFTAGVALACGLSLVWLRGGLTLDLMLAVGLDVVLGRLQ